MTDARFPERWLNDRRFVRLSDRAFRGYINALTWSVANRTDGFICRDDVDLIQSFNLSAAGDLVVAALLSVDGEGWLIREYEATQTSRAELDVLDNARRRDREKKRQQRARRAVDDFDNSRSASPGTNGGTALGQDRPGQDRPGQAHQEGAPLPRCTWHMDQPDAACRNCREESA
jgi:hypothetical protein